MNTIPSCPRFTSWQVVILFALAGRLADAAEPAAPRPPAELKELASIEQFLDLSDAELDQVQQVLARVRAMKPTDRSALKVEIAKFRQLPAAQRQQLRQGWGWMPREIQDAWREMMQKTSPERHAEIQKKLQAMSPEERLNYRRQLTEEYLRDKAAKK